MDFTKALYYHTVSFKKAILGLGNVKKQAETKCSQDLSYVKRPTA